MSKKSAIISGVAGLVVGLAGGFFAGGYYIKKKLQDTYDKDLEDMREYYRTKSKVEANDAAKAMISEKIEESKNDSKEQNFEEVPATFVEKDKEIYENMAHDYTAYHDHAKKPKERATVVDPEQTIYPIPGYQFDNDDTFKKETLYFYNGDETLADDEDAICSIDLVGDKDLLLKSFGNREDNEDEVTYIRNCDNETDYRVFFDERGYEDVFGLQ